MRHPSAPERASGSVARELATAAGPTGRATTWSSWLAAGYVGAFALWVLFHPGGPDQRELLSDLAPLPLGVAVWMTAWRVGRRPGVDPATRRAWRRIAASFLLWWLGDLVWFVEEVVLQRAPFPSPADIGYLLSYPVLAWGLLSLPGSPRRRSDWIKVALDAVTVFLAAAMVVWYLVVGPIIHTGAGALAGLLNVAYPVGDLVLLFGVAVVLLGRQARERSLWLLLGGVAALVLADLAYARLSLSDVYAGGDWPDLFWISAQLLFLLAALRHGRRSDLMRSPVRVRRVGDVSSLPYVAVVLGYGLLFAVGRQEALYPLNGLLFGAGAITAVVMVRQIRVTSENARLLGQLHQLADIDGLTSILNRRSFFEVGERLMVWAGHTSRPVTVLMIDVDHFKSVNDTFGHAVGDEVLIHVAACTKGQLRETDAVGRYGGDELAVVMPDCGVEQGLEVAERIRQAVSAVPVTTPDGTVRASLSIGVAEVGAASGRNLAGAMAQADAALYQAKAAGRDCSRTAA